MAARERRPKEMADFVASVNDYAAMDFSTSFEKVECDGSPDIARCSSAQCDNVVKTHSLCPPLSNRPERTIRLF